MPDTRYTWFDRWVAGLRFREARRHISAGSRICDVGCGTDPLFLKELGPLARLRVGLDYQRVNARGSGIHCARCDITGALPFADASFDHVTMLAVIEHLAAPEAIFHEIHRVLAPGGTVVMTWPSAIVDPLLGVLFRAGLVSPEMESHKHERRRHHLYWMGVLREVGFVNVTHRTFELGMNHLLTAATPTS
jgi:SAM-dependent methyltransferase